MAKTIELYDLLKGKLGEKESKALIETIEEASGKLKDDVVTKADLKAELAEVKTEILKWTFLFWIGQLAAMIALFKFFLK